MTIPHLEQFLEILKFSMMDQKIVVLSEEFENWKHVYTSKNYCSFNSKESNSKRESSSKIVSFCQAQVQVMSQVWSRLGPEGPGTKDKDLTLDF